MLSGWSVGRLGPVYYLAAAGEARVSQVHTIILFDPGSTSDFAKPSLFRRLLGRKTCDWRYDINSLLARWLGTKDAQGNYVNRLLIMAGNDSEEKVDGKPTYAGLWKYYLAGIWGKEFAARAEVCDYDGMSHPDVLRTFSHIVETPPAVGSCPTTTSGHKVTYWHVYVILKGRCKGYA